MSAVSAICLTVLGLQLPAQAALDPSKALTQYIHQSWQADTGLPQSSVTAVAQTPDGYIWVGTEQGLARFDGVRFTVYDKQHTPGLTSNLITVLLADGQNNLWIGTQGGGLVNLHDGRFRPFTPADGLTSSSILSLYKDRRGALWIGTDGAGLFRFQNGAFRAFTKTDGLADNAVFGISEDKHGALWLGTHHGLSRMFNGKFTTYAVKDGLGSNYVRAVAVDRQGTIWAGTNGGGLCSLQGGAIRCLTEKDGLTSNSILSLLQDQAGTLWIGTIRGGLNRMVNGKISSFPQNMGLSHEDEASLLEDKEGNLWIGSEDSGLHCLRNGAFATIAKEEGLLSDAVLPVYEDRDRALWVGTEGGLNRIKNGRVDHYTTAQGLPDNLVFSIAQDARGTIWAATRRGLAWLSEGRFHRLALKNAFLKDVAGCIYSDGKGGLWIGTRSGLGHYDGSRLTTYTTHDGLSNNFVLAIYKDRDSSLWIGTSGGGLNRFRNGRFTHYTTRDGLSSDTVLSIYGDAEGTLWIGTGGGGLSRFQSGRFTNYGTKQGLFDDSVFQVLDDGAGYLWMSSNKGIFSVSKDQLNAYAKGLTGNITSTVYGVADGMKSRECNGGFQPAGWRTQDGRLCFPTMKGVSIVDPARLARNEPPPAVVLEGILVNGKTIAVGNGVLRISPGARKLEFQFTGLSFAAPDKIQFRYILEGFDKEWNEAGTRRFASYTNVPPGEYRFRVLATNDGSVWSQSGPDVSLVLEPYYYQTTEFLVFVGFLAVGMGFAVHRLHVRHLKRQEKRLSALVEERTVVIQERENELRQSRDELELRVEERTQELRKLNRSLEQEIAIRRVAEARAEAASRAKSEFLTNMSHEIRTPINGIVGMTEITMTTNLDDDQREYLGMIKSSADTLLGIVNDVLDFSKFEAHELTLEAGNFRLPNVIEEVVESSGPRAAQKKLSFTKQIGAEIPEILIGDSERLRQILLNLLDNALKFTQTGSIGLNVSPAGCLDGEITLHFSVTDTGVGIPEEKQKAIFEPFSQGDMSSTRKYGGTGLGLTICSQLVSLMHGKIWVESRVGQGSTFHFTACFGVHPPKQPGTAEGLVAAGIALADGQKMT